MVLGCVWSILYTIILCQNFVDFPHSSTTHAPLFPLKLVLIFPFKCGKNKKFWLLNFIS